MKNLLLFSVVGFIAQLIDGSLGMAYGATSASLLLMIGVMPSVASASIHLAEIATTAASGISHIRFGNVDRSIVLRLIAPGSIGAFIGAALLSYLSGDAIKPYISFFLMVLGVYILIRFILKFNAKQKENTKLSTLYLIPLGLIAGFFDAIGGGGWGPITTPMLLAKKGILPRKVVGSVDTSEFAIAVSASLGFLIFLGWGDINWVWVGAFVIGGVIAAPIAAWFVKIVPSHLLGVLVGGLIIFTNARTLLQSGQFVPDFLVLPIYVVIISVWAGAVIYQIMKKRIN